MNDELRAAAKRWREGRYTPGIGPESGGMDAVRLADAYLAEHPADDEQEVDYEWLLKIGFNTFDEPHCLSIKKGDVRVVWIIKGQWLRICISQMNGPKYAATDIVHRPIRGDVRRLCKALGIELKEVLVKANFTPAKAQRKAKVS